ARHPRAGQPRDPARRGARAGQGDARAPVAVTPRRWPEGRHVAVIERRGRFRVAAPLFAPGGQTGLARGSVEARPGSMALCEPAAGGVRAVRALGSPKRARDVVSALLWEGLERRGFPAALEDEATDAIAAAP